MSQLKGGQFLLEALPQVRKKLGGKVELVFAGDGPERRDWEHRAARIMRHDPEITVRFNGWQERAALDALLDTTDLLVLPSVWPEPFGQAGPEAGLRGVPVAAFASGGIPDWLEDGVNGFTAPTNPPTAAGLSEAIVRCLADPVRYQRLRRGAADVARRYSMEAHLADLLPIFERAATARAR
jgi:glycosyltransferase involved in cell wall biosynthesis